MNVDSHGCDYWIEGRPTTAGYVNARYCEVPDAPYLDEVTDEQLCREHAGPLAWSARQVNLYSLALKVAGKARVIYLMPDELRARLYPSAGRAA